MLSIFSSSKIKNLKYEILILSLCVLCGESLSQDYVSDTLAVRAILDSNELFTLSVDSVTDSSAGRIVNLELPNNNLTTLPSEIGNLTALCSLGLSHNSLINIPKEICNLTALTGLNLYYNFLTNIPSEISNLKELTFLNLSHNNLTSLPVEIGNISNLKNLLLHENDLNSIPSEIGKISSLIHLSLFFNNLTTLPDSITNLTPTEHFSIGYNRLDTNNLSDTVIAWLDTYDSDWRETQNVPIIYNPKINHSYFSINIKKSSISLYLTTLGKTKLQIYNIKGRLLSTLVDEYKQAGKYTINIDRRRYSAGVYYIRLSVGDKSIVKKAALLI